jgi:hypothetical protein
MTKWEYLTLDCDRFLEVERVNDVAVKQIEADNVSLFGGRGMR